MALRMPWLLTWSFLPSLHLVQAGPLSSYVGTRHVYIPVPVHFQVHLHAQKAGAAAGTKDA